MNRLVVLILTLLFVSLNAQSQGISINIPAKIKKDKKYLFYLHGAIVQQQGANAVSQTYGKYLYNDILDTFNKNGFSVISEVRSRNTEAHEYATKIAVQALKLLQAGVPAKNITIVGASAGAYITIDIAMQLGNANINYAVMGMCHDGTADYYSGKKICGNFYSIYEASDGAGSCKTLLENKECTKGFEELELHMGNGHGFLYKPYPQWVQPLLAWINKAGK